MAKRKKNTWAYRGYTIVKTSDDFEVRDAQNKMVTWAYGLKGAKFFIDDLIAEA